MSINKFLDENFLFSSDTKISLESMVPDLLFGGEQEDAVSTEGFMDIVRKFTDWLFDDKPSALKLQGGFFQRKETIVKALEKTYLNSEWLSKRKLDTRPIPVDDSVRVIAVNGVVPRTREEASAAVADYVSKLKRVGDAYMGFLRTLDIELQRHQRKLMPSIEIITLWDVDEVENIINSLNTRITVNYRTLFGDTHVNRVISVHSWSEKDITGAKLPVSTIPPNTHEEVTECCHVLLQLADQWETSKDQLVDVRSLRGYKLLSDYCFELGNYINTKHGNQTTEVDTSAHEALLDLLNQVVDIPARLVNYHRRHTALLIKGYAKLIDRSVK